mgnify:CR=1 FL=1
MTPMSAASAESSQKRVTVCVSVHPLNSKWW